jgi:hypothetical protein
VRTKPIIGRQAWFGPRRWGWGLGPVTGAGWAVMVTGLAATIVLAVTVRRAPWVCLIPVAAMLAVIFLKGTSMGGPEEWAEFKAYRDGDRDS